LLGASFLIFVGTFLWTIILNPRPAPANPWGSNGLEWQTPTPVPYFNFERIPIVLSDPYHYGEPTPVPVADLGPGLPAAGVIGTTLVPPTQLGPRPPL
jgi:cytochrome c oxidase subunit 1